MMNTAHIRQLISQNQLGTVIQQLQKDLAGTTQENIISIMASEYTSLQNRELMKTTSADDLQRSKNDLGDRLLRLLHIIDQNKPAELDHLPKTPTPPSQRTINQHGKNSVYIEKNDGNIHFQ